MKILRIFYRRTKWASFVSKAKEEARLKGVKDWKEYFYESNYPVDPEPPHLMEEQKNVFSMIYQSLSNYVCKEVYQKEPFPHAMSLENLVDTISRLGSEAKKELL